MVLFLFPPKTTAIPSLACTVCFIVLLLHAFIQNSRQHDFNLFGNKSCKSELRGFVNIQSGTKRYSFSFWEDF